MIDAADAKTLATWTAVHFRHVIVCPPKNGNCSTCASVATRIQSVDTQKSLQNLRGKGWSAVRVAALNAERERLDSELAEHKKLANAKQRRYKAATEHSLVVAKITCWKPSVPACHTSQVISCVLFLESGPSLQNLARFLVFKPITLKFTNGTSVTIHIETPQQRLCFQMNINTT